MHVATSPAFKQNAHAALGDPGVQKALARSGPSFIARRSAAVAALPEFEQLRDTARAKTPLKTRAGFRRGST
jgi:L-lactate dehydrogenase complex protein LldF